MRLEPSELGCASAFLKQGPDTSRPLRFTLFGIPQPLDVHSSPERLGEDEKSVRNG
jgi:hypothetical protein